MKSLKLITLAISLIALAIPNTQAAEVAGDFCLTPTMAPFNAAGDGTTDDTTALQGWIKHQALTNNNVLLVLPAKNFKTKQLKYYANTRIFGLNREQSILIFDDSTKKDAMVPADETDVNARSFSFTDFTFKITNSASTTLTNALRIKGPSYGKVDFCRFEMMTAASNRTAIVIDGNGFTNSTPSYYNNFLNNQILSAYVGVRLVDAANCNDLIGNTFSQCGYGVLITNSNGSRIIGNNFQDSTNGYAVWLRGANTYGNTINGNWIENVDTPVYSEDSAHDNLIIANKCGSIHNSDGISYGGSAAATQFVDDAAVNTYYDVGRFRQFKALMEYGSTTMPTTNAYWVNSMFAMKQDSTHNSAAVIQLRNAAGFDAMVPFALPEVVEDIAAGDTTPSVKLKRFLRTANTSDTTITDFDDGRPGQTFFMWVNDSHTTLSLGSAIRANVNSNYKCRDGDMFQFILDDASHWRAFFYPATWGFAVDAAAGCQIRPVSGTSYDFSILKADGTSSAMHMTTGTKDFIFEGKIAVSGNGNQTITSGSAAPTSSESNGSIYLRSGGESGSTFYVRESGAWVAK